MSKWRVSITRTDDAGADVYARRKELAETQVVTLSVLYDDPIVTRALRKHAEMSAGSLNSKATKIGLKPLRDETAYGIHASQDGPIEFWVQRVFV